MSESKIDLKRLFIGGRSGQGRVTGLTGRRLPGFTVAFFGEWSIGGDALHLDETLVYEGGREIQRHWAVQFDADGGFVGYDSHQAARLRGRAMVGKARLIFDRPLGLTAGLGASRATIDLIEMPDDSLRLSGRRDILGLVTQRTEAMLRRV